MTTRTETVYYSDDGKRFLDKEECLAHDLEINAEAGYDDSVIWYDLHGKRLTDNLKEIIEEAWFAVVVDSVNAKKLFSYCYEQWGVCFLENLARYDLETGVVYSWNSNGYVYNFTAKVKEMVRMNTGMLADAEKSLENS